MEIPQFTHLHLHTQYSILDGAALVEPLLQKVADEGMKAVAITDHGNMYGVLPFVNKARELGLKPIIGCEVYVARNSRYKKDSPEDRSGWHLVLLAKNLKGYHNLSKMVSLGFLEGFYYTPRVDKELLRKYSEGIVAISACLAGEVPRAILRKDMDHAEKVVKEFIDIYGEDFYLELQRHGIEEQTTVNAKIIELARKLDVKFIATNDVHFIDREDARAHDILICLQTGRDLEDTNRMKYTGNEYLKSRQEMYELFSDIPEAITNTQLIADKIEDYDISTKEILLPSFPLPEGFESEDEYLKHLTYEGAKKLYNPISEKIRERMDFELGVVVKMGFAGYFLIVQDFINESRKLDVWVGPGRGSVAGSIIAYCTGITTIDPIKYNLIFERFLNPERVSMPDIDIDFDDEGRNKVLNYVIEKYGRERVAQIVTFGTMAAKSSIRDVARVLKLPLPEADRLAKLVPERAGTTLTQAYKEIPDLNKALNDPNPLIAETLKYAKILEGSTRQTGTHACGVIIGPKDLVECLPLSTQKDSDLPVTQYEGKNVEQVGMLKMDFLGLRTLSIMKDAVRNIKLTTGKEINVDKIPLDDEATFKLYQRGDTIGTFQFESPGMREYLKELKPTNIEDLIAMNALYRPGPMDFIPTYINRKHGRQKTEYPHPWLVEILKPTHGIMVYQEQIMEAARIMAGYTLSSADILRRAMGKKKKEIMDQQKGSFIDGAVKKGIGKDQAGKIFDTMARFAQYGFNRSHSAAYSVLAYQTGFLKANYPAEFMASVLTNNFSDIKKIAQMMEECQRQKIPALGPDINESDFKFVVNKKREIRFGLGAVKGVGEGAVEAIVTEREKNGPYKNIFDFAMRVNLRSVNKKVFESLAKAGAFDGFEGIHRAQFFHSDDGGQNTFIDKVIRHANLVAQKENSSQISLFDDTHEVVIPDPEMPVCEPWDKLEAIKYEKEVTGMYIMGHPLDDFQIEIKASCNVTIFDLNDRINDFKHRDVTFAGIITDVAHRVGKSGKPWGSFTIEDYSDSIQLALFGEDYLRFKHLLVPQILVHVNCRVQEKYNSNVLEARVRYMSLLGEAAEKSIHDLVLLVPIENITDSLVKRLKDLAKKHKGNTKLKFAVIDRQDNISVEMISRKVTVNSVAFLKDLLKEIDLQYRLN